MKTLAFLFALTLSLSPRTTLFTMPMQNRLQAHWNQLEPKILAQWEDLNKADLSNIDGRFDRLIDVIRRRYKPGRSPISVEAKIYDWILTELNKLDKNIEG